MGEKFCKECSSQACDTSLIQPQQNKKIEFNLKQNRSRNNNNSSVNIWENEKGVTDNKMEGKEFSSTKSPYDMSRTGAYSLSKYTYSKDGFQNRPVTNATTGSLTYNNNQIYSDTIMYGLEQKTFTTSIQRKDGFYTLPLSNNRTFSVYYKEGKPEGFGKIVDSSDKNVVLFQGEFKKGVKDGFGIEPLENNMSNTYEGEFSKDMKNGLGFETCKDSYVYIGEFKNNEKNGIGTLNTKEGYVYFSEFVNGRIEGFCIKKDKKTGEIFQGELVSRKREGYGELITVEKEVYFGFFYNDKKSGFGVQRQKDSNFYVGFWNEDKMEGIGKLIIEEKVDDKKNQIAFWIGGKIDEVFEGKNDNKIKNYLNEDQRKYFSFLTNVTKEYLKLHTEKIISENTTKLTF